MLMSYKGLWDIKNMSKLTVLSTELQGPVAPTMINLTVC
jgi:hypothetical protein